MRAIRADRCSSSRSRLAVSESIRSRSGVRWNFRVVVVCHFRSPYRLCGLGYRLVLIFNVVKYDMSSVELFRWHVFDLAVNASFI